jgi:hypothetical protein
MKAKVSGHFLELSQLLPKNKPGTASNGMGKHILR